MGRDGVDAVASDGVSARHRWTPRLSLAFSVLVALTSGAITPLAHATPPDQTWISGFYDNADYDDAILAVVDTDGCSPSGEPLVPWISTTQLRFSGRPASVPSHPRLTLADRAPPVH